MTTPLEWDPRIAVGSFITAYHTGVHRVTQVEPEFYEARHWMVREGHAQAGDEAPPTLHYVKVMGDDYGPPRAKRKNSCDASYCTLVDSDYIAQLQQDYAAKIRNLQSLVDGNWKV